MAFQRFLLAHQFRFLGGVIIPFNYRIEKRIQKSLKAKIEFFNLGALFDDHPFGGLGGLFLFLFNPCEHFVRPVCPQFILVKKCGDLCVEGFFADEWLGAALHTILSGATVVDVAFLNFGSDADATATAAKKAHERFGLPFYGLVFWRPTPTVAHDGMHGIKEAFGNYWLMCALMHFARVAKMAVINRVGKNLCNVPPDQQFAVSGVDAMFA